jgi:hypothetical protein
VIAVQASRSKVDVLRRWPVVRNTAPTAAHAAAMSWARRAPPSSRAIMAVRTTIPAVASADGSRSKTRLSGAIVSISPAIAGVSGPWSA